MKLSYLKAPLNRYTFSVKPIREWVEEKCFGKVLNLFAGKTRLNCNEIRVDANRLMDADFYIDSYNYVKKCKERFDVIILDPPYSYRKSMEMYGGKKMSRFNALKDKLPKLLNDGGKVITFGYHSVSMGKSRGFKQEEVLLISHGGAIHDTIAVVEKLL